MIAQHLWPRPVCLVCSCNKEGKPNVMTASFVMPISFKPKYVAFSVAPSRLTFSNLKEVREFTLNVCSREQLKAALLCGQVSGRQQDKFKLAGLIAEASLVVRPPQLKQCPISYECKVELLKPFGDHYLVVGRVVKEKIRKERFEPLVHKFMDEFPELK